MNTINPAGTTILQTDDTPIPPPGRPVPGTADEFERFENLTGKLVQVPKTEVDEKRG